MGACTSVSSIGIAITLSLLSGMVFKIGTPGPSRTSRGTLYTAATSPGSGLSSVAEGHHTTKGEITKPDLVG